MIPLARHEWYDLVVIGLIIGFMYLKAVLIARETRLGAAMALTNLVIASAYLWSLIEEQTGHRVFGVDLAFRVAILASVLWCVSELLATRRRARP